MNLGNYTLPCKLWDSILYVYLGKERVIYCGGRSFAGEQST